MLKLNLVSSLLNFKFILVYDFMVPLILIKFTMSFSKVVHSIYYGITFWYQRLQNKCPDLKTLVRSNTIEIYKLVQIWIRGSLNVSKLKYFKKLLISELYYIFLLYTCILQAGCGIRSSDTKGKRKLHNQKEVRSASRYCLSLSS